MKVNRRHVSLSYRYVGTTYVGVAGFGGVDDMYVKYLTCPHSNSNCDVVNVVHCSAAEAEAQP